MVTITYLIITALLGILNFNASKMGMESLLYKLNDYHRRDDTLVLMCCDVMIFYFFSKPSGGYSEYY